MNQLLLSSASLKSGNVLLCLGCLATDCKLYVIQGNIYQQTLEELTGFTVSGGFLCCWCLKQLQRCQSFRQRCVNTKAILKELLETTEDTFVSVDRTNLKENFDNSQITTININPRPISTKKLKDLVRTNTLFVNIQPTDETFTNTLDLAIADKAVKNDNNFENTATDIDNDYTATSTDDEETNYDDFTWSSDDAPIKQEKKPKRKVVKKVTRQNSKAFTRKAPNNENLAATKDANNANEITVILPQNDEVKDVDTNLCHNANKVNSVSVARKIDGTDELHKSKLLYRVFVNIWRGVSKNKGDIHDVFLKIYKVSFLKYRPTKMPKNVLRKTISESVKIMKFVDLHKDLADFYNVDIKFINIEEQTREMNEKRTAVAGKEEHCKFCCKKYVKNGSLERHVNRLHDETLPFRCKVCLYTFDKQCHLAAHVLKSHAMEVRCRDCGALLIVSIASNWMTEAKTHKALHLGDVATCEFCGKTFTARKLYYMHIRAMHRANIDAMTCLLCGDSYNGPAGLRSHIHRMHPEAKQCTTCSVLFLNEDTLAIHAAEGGDCQTRSSCARCGASFSTDRLVKEHYDDLHAKCKCDVCKQSYYGKKKNKEHLKVCKGNPFMGRKRGTDSSRKRKATCEGDGKQKRNCFNSLKPEHVKGDFVCEVCGQGFKSEVRIKTHQRKHAVGDKPYICDLCGKAFRLKLTLKTHMFVHTGERPYKCSFCPKTFRQHPHLKAHMPTHTQEKAHECHICKKRFTNKSNRRTHVKTVHEGLPARKKKRPL